VGDQLTNRRGPNVNTVKSTPLIALSSSFGQISERPGRKIVGDIDIVAFGQQSIDQSRPDEPSTASY
jgi:hypothetical protein